MKVAIIPAAGKGTRFHELGKNYPKTLLPYDGIPIIERIIMRLHDYFDEIRIVTGDDGLQISSLLQGLNYPKVTLVEVPTDGNQGPGRSFIEALSGEEDYVFLHLSDTLFDFEFEKFDGDWVSVMDVSDPHRWCMINPDGDLMDKPKNCGPRYKAMTGAYSFSNPRHLKKAGEAALVKLTEKEEFQLSHIFKKYNDSYRFRLIKHPSNTLLDFGTAEEYFRNNKSIGSRHFNKIEFTTRSVSKTSKLFPNKIISEALWLQNAPTSIQHFLPKVLGIDIINGSYEIERIKSVKLRDLFIHLDRDVQTWKPILDEITAFLEACRSVEGEGSFWKDIYDKTRLRRPDLAGFCDEFWACVKDCGFENKTTIFHGDLHFNNMFFDFGTNQLSLIDPRGEFFGHWLYDVAKLIHSVVGKFDFIDSRLFSTRGNSLNIYSAGTEQLETLFKNALLDDLSASQIRLVHKTTASLFASMQPLHNDFPEKNVQFEKLFHQFNRLAS